MDQPYTLTAVVRDELRFKGKLAIGENAYKSLRTANIVRKYWDLFGAMGGGATMASSPFIASTFFAPQGLLGLLGFATAATPIGWIVAAGVLSGGIWYGVMKTLNGATEDRITVIPKFINTPIDVLAATLFSYMAPIALKMAAADGLISEDERLRIREYFVNDWGLDSRYVDHGLPIVESHLAKYDIAEVAETFAKYKQINPDCNYSRMVNDQIDFLREVMEIDGQIDEREQELLAKISEIFEQKNEGIMDKIVPHFLRLNSENKES